MKWIVKGHENMELMSCRSWDIAQAALSTELNARIESLLDDVVSGDITDASVMRDSLHSLIEAYLELHTGDTLDEEFTALADGIQFQIVRAS